MVMLLIKVQMMTFLCFHYFLFSGASKLLALPQQDSSIYYLFKIMLSYNFFLSLLKEYAI